MERKIYGWTGRILRVDLTNSRIVIKSSKKYVNRFIGGRGVSQWILFNEVEPDVRPLDPDNRMIFGTGPLTATMAPASCRLNVDTKNPLTGGTSTSNCGGNFAPELKFAGFDFIIIQGRAQKPVYIWINNSQIEIRDASHLWGKNTWETEDALREDLGEKSLRVACIGPAGENLVKAACIIVDKSRAAGRGGSGAVMGSKNLKAIAVRGTGRIEVFDPDGFMKMVDEALRKINESAVIQIKYRKGGTHEGIEATHMEGGTPVRNFQDDYWDPLKLEKIKQSVFRQRYELRRMACFNCPIYCSHFYEVREGPYEGLTCEGFEQQLALDLGTKLDIEYPPALIKMHATCSQLGLDTGNSSGPISWAFELFERGILTKKDTDGLELNWGDYRVAIKLLEKMAKREGVGDILAEGTKRASERLGRGSEKYALHIKGQDLSEAIRADKGWALGVVTSPRGGGHCAGGAFVSSRVPKAGNQIVYEGKPEIVFWFEKYKAVLDMLGICYFTSLYSAADLLDLNDYANLFSKATGINKNGNQLLTIGQRVHNVEKAFNTLHAGFKRTDDFPPARLMEEPIRSGLYKGELLEIGKWEKMLDEYYKLHGWDKETGWQTKESLLSLRLVKVMCKLLKAGRLVKSTNNKSAIMVPNISNQPPHSSIGL